MQPQLQRSSASTALWGAAASGIGLYLLLVGAKLLPPPGEQYAPAWIVVCCGLVFGLGGLAIVMQAIGRADERGELPPDAPPWIRRVQHLTVLIIIGLFATIGTWVALFGDGDHFTMTSSFTREAPANPIVARTAFGIGAVIMWAWFVAMVRRSRRVLRG
jgi:hypothetical protein